MAETTRRASGSTTAPKTEDTPVVKSDVDPELTSGQSVEETKTPEGLAGVHGFDDVAPDSEESKADALKRAQVVAPHVTAEFVKVFKLTPETVSGIADGTVAPPPAIGPNYTGDLYLTPGGWVHTKPGVAPGETSAISR